MSLKLVNLLYQYEFKGDNFALLSQYRFGDNNLALLIKSYMLVMIVFVDGNLALRKTTSRATAV